MSTFAVTAEQLVIHPHPNADLLELAQVGEYRAVVGKGSYKTGDYGIYIPEQSILPDDLIEELGLTGKLAGKQKNRVKAVRLRGELSQGIVCMPLAVTQTHSDEQVAEASPNGTDFAELLGITKWVPEVPSCLDGEVEPATNLMRWIDIENIKRYPHIFEADEQVIATEKIHGSCCCITYDAEKNQLLVSSKGFVSKFLAIMESESNLYWRAVRAYNLEPVLKEMAQFFGVSSIAMFGEVYGPGVQDLGYAVVRKDSPGFAAFDIKVTEQSSNTWIEQGLLHDYCAQLGVPTVPILFEGFYNYEELAQLAEGNTKVADVDQIREGLVIRSVPERYSSVTGNRAIAKLVSAAYLTRTGGTEYE